MVRAMKYHDSAWIAGKIADCMYDRWIDISDGTIDVSLVAPIPMTEAKMQRRGYDQARLIARKFAYLTGATLAEGLLLRVKDTSVMSGLGAYERRANMAGAFALDSYAQRLIGRGTMAIGDVILIDDVLTTGSSAVACAATLKEAGAGKITLFTFAVGADINVSHDEPDC
jgi:predicted amidophosphoribosyltransferase